MEESKEIFKIGKQYIFNNKHLIELEEITEAEYIFMMGCVLWGGPKKQIEKLYKDGFIKEED